MTGATAGGYPIRIYGSGFLGTTSVKFGTQNATSFSIIDGHLITAIVPAAANGTAANNTFVDVSVTDPNGTGVWTGDGTTPDGFFYTNASYTTNPSTGLDPRENMTATLDGYQASVGSVILPEFNPLLLYVEQAPEFPFGPPPYAQVLADGPTDANGDLTKTFQIPRNFAGNTSYDPNAVCPVNQTTANYLGKSPVGTNPNRVPGAGKCHMAVGQWGRAMMEVPFSYTNDPTPAAPVLNLSATSANQGATVNFTSGSINWNANPMFGSSTTPSKPGETSIDVTICGIGNNEGNCSANTTGTATVSMTRYINLAFSGATLTGSVTVGSDIPDNCTTCFVRVRQYRPFPGGAALDFVKGTKALTIT